MQETTGEASVVRVDLDVDAQHALNALLQSPFFSVGDLADTAHRLDVTECCDAWTHFGRRSRVGSSEAGTRASLFKKNYVFSFLQGTT
jgi:hypothetical protein